MTKISVIVTKVFKQLRKPGRHHGKVAIYRDIAASYLRFYTADIYYKLLGWLFVKITRSHQIY